MDEITSMLDPMGRERILQVIRKLHEQGMTIIWLTQWMEELEYATRIVAIQDGRIYFEGTKEEFFYGTNTVHTKNDVRKWNEQSTPCHQLGFVRSIYCTGRLFLDEAWLSINKITCFTSRF